jgi:succinoglycan biosynthesis transport protein ExoP
MPPDQSQSEHRTLGDYLAVVRRRKWIVILPLLVVPAAAFLYSAQQDARYEAKSEVWISRSQAATSLTGITNPDANDDPSRFAETQSDLARVPEVVTRAIRRSGVTGVTPQSLLFNSSVRPRTNSDLLTFAVEDTNPTRAAKLVTAYANSFSDYRLQLATASLANARADLESNLRKLQKKGMADTNLYRQLEERTHELRTLELLQTKPTVVQSADDATQIAPTPKRNAMLGLALGLLLGLAAAFVWEALDRRVRDETDVEAALGIPLLARISSVGRTASGQAILAMQEEPTERDAESIRRLRTSLEFANLDLKAKVVMVTSAVPEEGKSLAVANLALALAHSGRRVALVDLDLRRPSMARLFGVGSGRGITDIALREIDLDSALVRIPLRPTQGASGPRARSASHPSSDGERGELLVLSAGTAPSSPAEFLGSRMVHDILDNLRGRMDYVLVDAPPMLPVSDAAIISNHVDATLVVVRLGRINRSNLRELARELDATIAPKLGFVITGSDPIEFYGTYGALVDAEPGRPSDRRSSSATVAVHPTQARATGRDDSDARRWA